MPRWFATAPVSVLDLEQYRLDPTVSAPTLGCTSDTDVSLSTMSIRPVGRPDTSADVPGDLTVPAGGAYRDRTDDLLNANQALSQLS